MRTTLMSSLVPEVILGVLSNLMFPGKKNILWERIQKCCFGVSLGLPDLRSRWKVGSFRQGRLPEEGPRS